MKTCDKCKTQNPDNVMFCTTCGTQLKIAADPVQAPAPTAAPATAPTTAFAPAPVAPAKKPVDVKTIGLIAAAAIGLIVGIVGIVMAINAGNTKKETPAAPVAPVQNDDEDIVTANNVSGNQTGTAVKVGPYTMTIPKDFPFETTDNGVLIADPTNTVWAANISYDNSATYSQVSTNLKKLGEYYTENGLKNVKTGTAKVGNLNYLYVDMLDTDNIAKTLAIFKADSALFDVIVTDGSIVPNHGIVDIIAPIIANAKSGNTTNREIGFGMTTKGVDTFNLDGIFDGFESSEE